MAAGIRMAGLDRPSVELSKTAKYDSLDINKAVIHSMQPALLGAGLDKMNRTMASHLCRSVTELLPAASKPRDLYLWCRETITLASAKAVWGPNNPFDDPLVREAFWDYDSNLAPLLIGVFPSFIAKKAYYGREKVVTSFVKYYEAGGQLQDASSLAYARWKTQSEVGFTTETIARLETATAIAILSNTVVLSFWTLFDIYSRPSLLTTLRHEITQNALSVPLGTNTHTLDIGALRDSCPALTSTFQEVLRTRSMASPLRVLRSDTVLDKQYLLRANALLIMPSASINHEARSWGDDDGFDPLRFTDGAKRSPSSFMAFGAAPELCPGRHFATGEILAMVAMVVLRFEVRPVGDWGKWVAPGKVNLRAVAATVAPPDEASEVLFEPVREYEGSAWDFVVTEGKGRFGLVTG